jgi:hypothetical protein
MTLFETLRGNAGLASSASGQPRDSHRPQVFAYSRTAQGFLVELRPLRACAEIEGQWRDLARRGLEQNVFHEPEFALAAAQHLVGGDRLSAILLWEPKPGGDRLMALLPVMLPERRPFAGGIRGIDNPYHGSGVPLVDRARADDVIAGLLDWLVSANAPSTRLLLPRLDPDGPFAAALLAISRRRGLNVSLSERQVRSAVLQVADDGHAERRDTARLQALISALESKGKPAIVSAKSGVALRDAVELYLTLEASGEPGRNGTAMMLRTRTGAFLRAATRGLGCVGQCRVLTLMLDERPLASAVIYRSGSRASLVHLAADERYAAFAPEEVLLLTIAQRQRKDRGTKPVTVTECGLMSQSPLVERTWPDRLVLSDIAFDARKPGIVIRPGVPNMTFAYRTGRYLTRLMRRKAA